MSHDLCNRWLLIKVRSVKYERARPISKMIMIEDVNYSTAVSHGVSLKLAVRQYPLLSTWINLNPSIDKL